MRDLAAPVLAAAVCSNGVPAHGLCSDEGNCWPQQVSMESEPGPYSMSLMDMRFGPSHECCPFESDMVARHPHKRGPSLKQGCIGSQHVHRLPQGQPPSPRPLFHGLPIWEHPWEELWDPGQVSLSWNPDSISLAGLAAGQKVLPLRKFSGRCPGCKQHYRCVLSK